MFEVGSIYLKIATIGLDRSGYRMINSGGCNPGNSKPATSTAIQPRSMRSGLTQEVIKHYEKKIINLGEVTFPKVVVIVQQVLKDVNTRRSMHWEINPVLPRPFLFLPNHVVLSWVSQNREQSLSAEGIQIHEHNYPMGFARTP